MKIILLLIVVLLVATLNVPAVDGGFGCPLNEYECDRHCREDLKCRGGYCDVLKLRLVCTCFGCEQLSTQTSIPVEQSSSSSTTTITTTSASFVST
ncbi:hypothetical protein CHS0354_018597 [Potamilus streckersoni]|uniref:Invertebrate defensins family profile domain-containing protein n=1 Tax=Potamilus streckersoni TaxID=2493646 RepID=A0AAE0WD12_9BIVA|nr:hypothetical protein CHS0354_018597 [Potamilus streckersoni]